MVVNEWGAKDESVGDPTNILHRVLPAYENREYVHLNAVDWYGDTYFNYLQIPRFLVELQTLNASVSTPEERQLLEAINRLATRVGEGRHMYLKFIGD